MKYWVGVISKSHIKNGFEGGFIQLNHGKKTALQKMHEGDWIVIYSPKFDIEDKKPCQYFTAVGKIRNGNIYQTDMGNGFIPYRLDVDYIPAHETPIQSLLDKLSFTKDKTNWGYSFRFGHFEITRDDFQIIIHSMGINSVTSKY